MNLKLVDPPDDELAETARTFTRACQSITKRIEQAQLAVNFFAIREDVYRRVTNLPSEMRNNATKVVTSAWKSWIASGRHGHPPVFTRPIVYYSFRRDWNLLRPTLLSLRTLHRRVRITFATGDIDAERLRAASGCEGVGGAHLVRTSRGWFLRASVTLPNPLSWTPTTPIGVDRGVKWMLVARGPNAVPLLIDASPLNHMKLHAVQMTARLQCKATRSAKRVLRESWRKDRRTLLDAHRAAASLLLRYALTFERPVLVFENLKGIQTRCARRGRSSGDSGPRILLNGWAYRQLLSSVELAAEARGVPIAFVNPAWTSRTCPECGDARAANRRGSEFKCGYCGYRNHADVVGATNLARRWSSEHARGSWGSVSGPDECGHPSAWELPIGTVADAQTVDPVDGADTPLPTSFIK